MGLRLLEGDSDREPVAVSPWDEAESDIVG